MRAMSFNWIKLSVCVHVRALWMFCCASNTSLCVCHVLYIVGMSCVPIYTDHACMHGL